MESNLRRAPAPSSEEGGTHAFRREQTPVTIFFFQRVLEYKR